MVNQHADIHADMVLICHNLITHPDRRCKAQAIPAMRFGLLRKVIPFDGTLPNQGCDSDNNIANEP